MTGHADVTGNALLAARARAISNAAERGSMRRRSFGCAAIALSESTSIAAARKVLDLLWQADVKAAAPPGHR